MRNLAAAWPKCRVSATATKYRRYRSSIVGSRWWLALETLSRSQEFKRGADNSVYHKGYPINYREQGGAPSIQMSVAVDHRRVDIEITAVRIERVVEVGEELGVRDRIGHVAFTPRDSG